MNAPIVVLKFGSSVLPDVDALSSVTQEIYRHVREGRRVVAVVSAIGDRTNELLREARRVAPEPEPGALAALLATGERSSVALLALMLERAGLPSQALSPESLGLAVHGKTLDAEPCSVDALALQTRLSARRILVVPGFVGLDSRHEIALLGRGGSDLTALFLAQVLSAERCVLFKDVDGIYESDPSAPGASPRKFAEIPYDVAQRVGGGVVQAKAIQYARARGLRFEVRSFTSTAGTRVGGRGVEHSDVTPTRPLRVALAGLGVIGGCVYRALRRDPRRFEVVGTSSRDDSSHAARLGVDRLTWTSDPRALLARDPDVLVDLTGALEAEAWVACALRQRVSVVTASKRLLAESGARLERLALGSKVRLRGSAAVGGALPALETVRRMARQGDIASVAGVLNATCNFVLSCCEEGRSLSAALVVARRRGLCEADSDHDLKGHDAACKIVLLARAAFGQELHAAGLPRVVIDADLVTHARRVRRQGRHLRIVSRAWKSPEGVRVACDAVELEASDPLCARGVENRLVVTAEHGPPETWTAAGAGGVPTSLSVLADLEDERLVRARSHPIRDGAAT